MKTNIILALAILSSSVIQAKKTDPVLMTVNGEDIPVSEFKYLYNKNRQQQLEPQTIEDYLQMFEIYRLKVADAKAEGKDTTAAFRREMAQYRKELMQPYLADSAFIYTLIDTAFARENEEVEASHIMLLKTRDIGANLRSRQILDSLRTEIKNGADFKELASKYSQDRSVINNSGYLGFIASGRFPYSFESAVYETPEGEVSEIIESPVGYHLVIPGKRRPSKGKVEVAHIMKMIAKNSTPDIEEKQKSAIDSIYRLVIAEPDRFGELARTLSDDKGSARSDGKLPEFGAGEMVPEFEEASFNLAVGEISQPIKSQFGWHIIKKYGEKPSRTYDEVKQDVIKKISNPQDVRNEMINNNIRENLRKKYKVARNQSSIDKMKEISGGRIDSLIYTNWTQMPQSVATVADKEIPISRVASRLSKVVETRPEVTDKLIDDAINSEIEVSLTEAEEEWQYDNNEEYRNLIREYTDGSMLYEISVEKVWDKAAKDQDGLENYFITHKGKYNWDQPYAKGLLVQVANDSIAGLIKNDVEGLPTDKKIEIIKSKYPGKAQVEKFIVPQGVNAMVDNAMFGGNPAKPKLKNYETFIILEGRLLQTPEEWSDVRGVVTSDYQEALESEWISELKNRYPIIVNEKEFKKLKKSIGEGK